MPKKSKKPTQKIQSRQSALSQTTLLWLSAFFMLFAVFVILMYYKQVKEMKAVIRYQEMQREALLQLVNPSPTPKPVKK